MHPKWKENGFQLLEILLITSIIGSLLLASSYGYFKIQTYVALKNRTQALISIIQTAKLEALLNNETLFLKPMDDWNQGVILSDATHVLRTWQWEEPDFSVAWVGFLSNQWIRFEPDLHHMATSGHFIISDAHHQHENRIVINRLGVISSP